MTDTIAPSRSSAIGVAALVTSAVTFLLEAVLLGSNLLPPIDLLFPVVVLLLPVGLVASIVVCIIAGARGQRRAGLIGGALILLPFAALVVFLVVVLGSGQSIV